MKALTGALLLLSVLAVQPAAAAQWRAFGGGFPVQMQDRRDGFQRQQPRQREFQRPDRAPDRRHDGRLTDEERRDLHRDLDRASREIYKRRR